MENLEHLKKFLFKLCDSLYTIHHSSLKRSETKDSYLQILPSSYPHVHSEIEFHFPSLKTREVILEVVQEAESCFPLLLERWSFRLIPNTSTNSKADYLNDTKCLRAFLTAATLFPSKSIDCKSLYIRDSSLCTEWPKDLKASKLLRFPTTPYLVQGFKHSLQVQVQYYLKVLKPSICIQVLGGRPRLFSAECGEISQRLPHTLHERKSSVIDKGKVFGVMLNQNLYDEEEKVGIKLISSEVYEGSSFEEENFGRNSFDLEIEMNDDTPEEAKISLFMLDCDRIRMLEIFREADKGLGELVRDWRSRE